MILPVVLALSVALAAMRWWRGLLGWILATCGVLGTVLVLKLLFSGCEGLSVASGIRSPSGHTASAAVVYGGVVMLVLKGRVRPIWLAAAPLAFAGLFGASRLVLHVHTPVEVLIGGAVGLTGAAFMAVLIGPARPAHSWAWGLAAVVVAGLLHGYRLPAETMIRHFPLGAYIPLPAFCTA